MSTVGVPQQLKRYGKCCARCEGLVIFRTYVARHFFVPFRRRLHKQHCSSTRNDFVQNYGVTYFPICVGMSLKSRLLASRQYIQTSTAERWRRFMLCASTRQARCGALRQLTNLDKHCLNLQGCVYRLCSVIARWTSRWRYAARLALSSYQRFRKQTDKDGQNSSI